MTVYVAFNEYEALSNLSNITSTSITAVSGVSRAGFECNSASSNGTLTLDTPLTEGWFHVYMRPITGPFAGSFDGDFIEFFDSGDNLLFKLYWSSGSLSGGISTANSGATAGLFSEGVLQNIDIHWNISEGTDGFINLYVDEVLVYEESGATAASTSNTTVDKINFTSVTKTGGSGDGNQTHYGQVVVADEVTIGAKVYTLDPVETTNTTNNWDTGTVSDIDEENVDDSDQMTTTTNGDEVTYDTSITLSAPDAGKYWAAVTSTFRASYDASSAVTQLTPYLKDSTGTSEYDGTTQSLTTGLNPYYYTWNTDPATTIEWTESGINDYEYGLRAVT